jgi:O-glycosyl hydrolase
VRKAISVRYRLSRVVFTIPIVLAIACGSGTVAPTLPMASSSPAPTEHSAPSTAGGGQGLTALDLTATSQAGGHTLTAVDMTATAHAYGRGTPAAHPTDSGAPETHATATSLPAAAITPSSVVTIGVNGATRYQTVSGFGASFRPFDGPLSRLDDPNGPAQTTSTAEQRAAIAEILFTQLGLARTRVFANGFEPANDNADPFTFNPAGYDWTEVNQATDFVALARPDGLQTWWASFSMDIGHQQAWLRKPGSNCALNPALIDEDVEWLLAAAVHFRDAGQELPFMAVNNEPDLCPPGYKIEIADMVTIVKDLGARLRAEGLSTRIVVTDGWIPQNVLLYAKAVLEDPAARQYVGALAYHAYADGYDDPATVLNSSAQGNPPHAAVEVRERIRDLAARYGLPVWMTEICYCTPRSSSFSEFELLRARLNHLHDELTIADVSAFDAINLYNIRRPGVYDELVEVFYRPDGTMERYQISTYGRLLGHYSRFVVPGSVRLEADSGDPRVRAVAFQRPDGRPVLVLLNNNPFAVQTIMSFDGLSRVPASLSVLTSRDGAVWQSEPDLPVNGAEATSVLPSLSVTTYVGK